ncbi:PilZ domain-containing protein [Psychrosphaera ytuae]|uniref:PilZ domain-containing protein n=1 Tax=Psychrosphaera ytuae TaxID=2820710 RepID=A0A975HI39_9GAMM|nr:PilZ domain-containing protein [Psychrosphaera ytuae]QTH63841.1 PilZ domain-containing protein [Psychrosphaera ytuae]
MSAELQEFNDLIEDLKSVINQPNFDKVFKSKAADVPKAKQFLIKMELKRLAQPSGRLLDLRGHVKGDPVEYEYQDKTHYLDEIGRQIFEDQTKKFGQYTVGVYEAVMNAENNNRVIHKKEQQQRLKEKNQPDKPDAIKNKTSESASKSLSGRTIEFTHYGIRTEERMNFSIAVEIQFGLGNVLKAVSSDLSVGGIKVKIPNSKPASVGQKIAIYLTGLEQEFELGLKDGIQYEIVGIDEVSDTHKYIRAKRTFKEDIATFDEFLGNFINGNKRRYKVNFDNTLEAVTVKGFEQYYLPRVTSLPVFLRHANERFLPTLALATENNRSVLGHFSDENKNLVFQQILSQKRIARLARQDSPIKQTLLYSFTHAKGGKLYFYSATSEELNAHPKLRSLFIGFGSRKDSWNVFKLQLAEANADDAHLPLSIPDTASKEIQKLNRPPSPKVQGLLKGLSYVVVFTPLKNEQSTQNYQATYQYDRTQLSLLKPFSHPKLKQYINIEVETIDYVNLRSEERYLYKTSVVVDLPDDSGQISGSSRDISTYGLQVVTDTEAPFKKGDIIVLGLPDFQKVTQKFKLDKLAYEVMAISRDKTIMNLKVYDPRGGHQGRRFFYKLIRQNINKLTPTKIESKYPGLSKALRNIFAKHSKNMAMYINKDHGKFSVNIVGKGPQPNLLHHLMRQFPPEKGKVNLYPLVKDNAVNNTYAPIINEIERTHRPREIDLFVRYRPNQDSVERSFVCYFGDQFLAHDMLHSFVDASSKKDVFLAFRLFLSKTGRPDMNFVSNEIKYIHHYAMHKAKELEGELWSIIGVVDIVDISEEVMLQIGLSSERINQQESIKRQLLSQW